MLFNTKPRRTGDRFNFTAPKPLSNAFMLRQVIVGDEFKLARLFSKKYACSCTASAQGQSAKPQNYFGRRGAMVARSVGSIALEPTAMKQVRQYPQLAE